MKKMSFTKNFLFLSGTLVLLAAIATSVNQVQKQQATNTEAASCTHYVSTSGSDSNSGTSTSKAWRTIQKGVDSVGAGNVLCVRGGTYHERVIISRSGTSSNRLTVMVYPGEKPVIDGQYTLPTGTAHLTDPRTGNELIYSPLVRISGNYVNFEGFEVKRSRGRGVQTFYSYDVAAHHIEIKNNDIHDNRGSGVMIHDSENIVVDSNRVWHSCNYAPWVDGRSSVVNWPGGIAMQRSSYVTISNNQVFNNWGEGILPMASDNIDIVGNVVYDNFAAQIYLERSSYSTVERNLVYHTNDPDFRRGGDPSPCVGLADELHNPNFLRTPQRTRNVDVINNIIIGCRQNFFWWGSADGTNGLRDSIIAHNTIVNAKSNTGRETFGFNINAGNHTNSRIENNIILQDTGTLASVVNNANFARNLWSKTPSSAAQGYGDIIANPSLVSPGQQLVPGSVLADWYKLKSSSPAINKADSVPGASKDYFGSSRDSYPDIGAHEYGGSTPLPTTYSSPYPTSVATTAPTQVPTTAPTTTSIPPGSSGNVLINPSFESGTSPWEMSNIGGDVSYSVVTPGSSGNYAAKISVTNPGTQLQFYQSGISLEDDTQYTLFFDAYSNSGHDLSVFVHEHDDDFTHYGLYGHQVDLSTSWQPFSVTFTTRNCLGGVNDARLRFWFGPFDEANDEYFLDNVILMKTQGPSPSRPGDANYDGRVDGIDYVIWLNHFGITTQNGSFDGDFNEDTKVDGIDYVIWLTNVDI